MKVIEVMMYLNCLVIILFVGFFMKLSEFILALSILFHFAVEFVRNRKFSQ